jgi:alkanesulfonate monooxygenase SsuD/methylene tetrahydromethanopterin reductase-like flavin-dependent oxidoreductase (luciferase family)
MRYAINVPNVGEYADPRVLARMAAEAERAGWDGFFVWDHVLFGLEGPPVVDPWIALAAMAMETERIRIGPMVTPLPRRRPWIVARQAVALDQLSGGRAVLGVGLGAPPEVELAPFHETVDLRTRAEMLDEALAIITGLWSGEPFRFAGRHYQLDEVAFRPAPVQRPRIPIWVGGNWPNRGPFRRAARWEAAVPETEDGIAPDDVREVHAFLEAQRSGDPGTFDIVVGGEAGGTPAERAATVRAFAEAGATWWSERITPMRGSLDRMLALIAEGPPRI